MTVEADSGDKVNLPIHPYKQHLLNSFPYKSANANTYSLDSVAKSYVQSSGDVEVPSELSRDDLDHQPNLQPVISISSSKSSQTSGQLSKKRTKSIDLSHMYMLSNASEVQSTSTTEYFAGLSHQLVSEQFNNNDKVPFISRMKTIEMYKETAKKSRDPTSLFEYAQYMLQTALSLKDSNVVIAHDDDTQEAEHAVTEGEVRAQYLKEAQHYLKKLSNKGYTNAQYLLGDAFASGAFGKIDNKEAFRYFKAAAKHGHLESGYRVAYCFENGLGTSRDSRKAIDFLKFAASRNHPSAMYKLGMYSFHGLMGLPTDFNTKQNGIKWLSRATARANELTPAAPYELGKIYQKGYLDIIIPDEKYATELFIQAASLGHVKSSTTLGKIYEVGNSAIEQDTSLSVHYYTEAAVKGDPVAMLGLCAWYLLGAEPAFEKDENEAFQWAMRAAQADLPKAQFTLGFFYEKGKGCDVDTDEAWRWFEKAAANGDQRAVNKMKSKPSDNISSADNSGIYKKKRNKSVTTINLFSKFDDKEDQKSFDDVASRNVYKDWSSDKTGSQNFFKVNSQNQSGVSNNENPLTVVKSKTHSTKSLTIKNKKSNKTIKIPSIKKQDATTKSNKKKDCIIM